jgi:hypothetical protein
MAPAAELGPLDTQENREGEIRLRSLLDTADSIDTLFSQGVVNSLGLGGLILNQTGLTRDKTIEHILQYSAQFMRPLLEQIDPIAVNAANTSLNVASEYGARLLAYRNGRDGLTKAKAQTRRLVRDYPTHGYVIDRDEARDVLELPVMNIEEYDMLLAIETLYSQIQKSEISFVRLLPAAEFDGILNTEEQREPNDSRIQDDSDESS